MKKQIKLWHYTKLVMIPVLGNLYRCVYQGPANVVRFLYDFGRVRSIKKWKILSLLARQALLISISQCKYEYDGIDGSEIFQKWPTYTKTIAGFALDKYRGNCMDFAHAVKTIFTKTKIRIFIPDLHLTKVHYLAELYGDTYELVKSGVQTHTGKTARQVMEERYPENNIYRVW